MTAIHESKDQLSGSHPTLQFTLTSSVIVNPIKHSLTFRNSFGSTSLFSAHCTAALKRDTNASHSSSTSDSERNVPVVLRTWVSTMKNPVISWVTERKEARGRGVGRIRSDWACGRSN